MKYYNSSDLPQTIGSVFGVLTVQPGAYTYTAPKFAAEANQTVRIFLTEVEYQALKQSVEPDTTIIENEEGGAE